MTISPSLGTPQNEWLVTKDFSVGFLYQCFLISFPLWRSHVLLIVWHPDCWGCQVSPRRPTSQHNPAYLLLRGPWGFSVGKLRSFWVGKLWSAQHNSTKKHLLLKATGRGILENKMGWPSKMATTDSKMNIFFWFLLLTHPPYCWRCKINGNTWRLSPQNVSNSHAIKWKNKNKNNPRVIIKFSVLFKILVLILKKEVHFLFLVLALGYNQVSVFFSPVFSILHKCPETTGLSKSCRRGRQRFAPDGDQVAPEQRYLRVPLVRWI